MSRVRAGFYRADERLTLIAKACSELCHVPIEKFYARSREPQFVFARQLAFYVARGRGFSLPQIGAHYRRDHSTVLYGIRKVQGAMNTRPDLLRIAQSITAYLEAHAA